MAEEAPMPATPPQRLARYRSQRKPQTPPLPDQPPEVPQVPVQDTSAGEDNIARSKSRYRRAVHPSRPGTARDQEPSPSSHGSHATQRSPPQHARPQAHPASSPPQRRSIEKFRPIEQPEMPMAQTKIGNAHVNKLERVQSEGWGPYPRGESHQEALAQTVSPHPPNANQLFPPPRLNTAVDRPSSRRDGPPSSGQIQATKSTNDLRDHWEDDLEDDRSGCFGLFKRKRGEAAPSVEKRPIARPVTSNGPTTIKPGGGGIVPGTDAPVSAVNAGERLVTVVCGTSKSILPVTPTTTPVDLIKATARTTNERIDVRSAVLLESFSTVGVQRPLRRYEHVRDVMNSWDWDRQNNLVVVDLDASVSEAELELAGVPPDKPGDESWPMLFSQRPGKWDKRRVSLKSDGQMTMQKDARKTEGQENVCHLSDFDIYTPTAQTMRKKIKPPKRFCYAVKSQQKTSMFESTQNFVHFFCTADKATADSFYAAIQGWRSWYLVNVLGEGKRSPAEGNNSATTHRRQEDSQDSTYELGSFKPLLNSQELEHRRTASNTRTFPPPALSTTRVPSDQLDVRGQGDRSASSAMRQPQAQLAEDEPLGNLGRRVSTDRRRTPTDKADEFAATGLLGRSYSQRQREHATREAQQAGPFTNGPSLLNSLQNNNNDIPKRQPSTRTNQPKLPSDPNTSFKRNTSVRSSSKPNSSNDLIRSNSTARNPNQPKPLVDLTPRYCEPPQHTRKGNGFNLDGTAAAAGPLIESATSPEDPLGIPPSTDWRGRNAFSNHDYNTPSPDTRSHSMTKTHNPGQRSTTATTRANDAFTGEGLLATQHSGGWSSSAAVRGRGVMDGSKANGPMLDMSRERTFAPGSLLERR